MPCEWYWIYDVETNALIEYRQDLYKDGELHIRRILNLDNSETDFYLEYGYDEAGRLIETTYRQSDGTLFSPWTRIIREYDALGREIREGYYNMDEMLVDMEDGYAYRATEYSADGLKIVKRYYHADGSRAIGEDGWFEGVYIKDAYGRSVSSEFHGINGETVVASDLGYAGIEYEYFERNAAREHSWDADGRIVNDNVTDEDGRFIEDIRQDDSDSDSVYYHRYFEKSIQTRIEYLNADLELMDSVYHGCAYTLFTYPETGQMAKSYYDLSGNLIRTEAYVLDDQGEYREVYE